MFNPDKIKYTLEYKNHHGWGLQDIRMMVKDKTFSLQKLAKGSYIIMNLATILTILPWIGLMILNIIVASYSSHAISVTLLGSRISTFSLIFDVSSGENPTIFGITSGFKAIGLAGIILYGIYLLVAIAVQIISSDWVIKRHPKLYETFQKDNSIEKDAKSKRIYFWIVFGKWIALVVGTGIWCTCYALAIMKPDKIVVSTDSFINPFYVRNYDRLNDYSLLNLPVLILSILNVIITLSFMILNTMANIKLTCVISGLYYVYCEEKGIEIDKTPTPAYDKEMERFRDKIPF